MRGVMKMNISERVAWVSSLPIATILVPISVVTGVIDTSGSGSNDVPEVIYGHSVEYNPPVSSNAVASITTSGVDSPTARASLLHPLSDTDL